MASNIVQEGLEFILEAAFSEEQSIPANYYIGLSQDSVATLGETASLSDITEVTGTGYSRESIASSATGFPTSASTGTNDWYIGTDTVTFEATAGDWDEAVAAFLATTNDNTGKLIAVVDLSGPTTVDNGETLDVSINMELDG